MKYKVLFAVSNKTPLTVEADDFEVIPQTNTYKFYKDKRLVASFGANTLLGVVEVDAMASKD